MAEGFAQRRFEWLDQILSDSSNVSAAAFKLAYAIGGFVNRETGDAWPSQTTLASRTGFTERGIRKLAEQLVSAGHMTVTSAHGRKHSNRYRPIFKNGESTLFPLPAEKAPSNETRRRRGDVGKRPEIATAFEEFWRAYPRKVAKGQARRVYERIIASKAVTTADLLNGALRYAAECTDREARYVKHGATWLHGECWSDEPTIGHNYGAPKAGLESAADGIAEEMFGDDR